MASRLQNKLAKEIEKLTARFGRALTADFLNSVAAITDGAIIADIIAAIEAGDFEKVVKILSIDNSAFRAVEAKIGQAFEIGGQTVAATIPAVPDLFGIRAPFRFDVRSTRAEEWLRSHSSRLITRVVEDAREAVRVSLQDSMLRGVNPRTAALDIVGRIDPITKRRTGGIVGLNHPQAKALTMARREVASVDPEDLRNYLRRARRDARLDSYVNEALRTGKAIPSDVQQKMIGQYSNRLLKLRGDTIGRKEMIETLNHAQWESYNQAIDAGKIKTGAALKEWDSAGPDGHTRDSHLELDSQPPRPINEPFLSPATGRAMMFPGDTAHGAAGEDVINCRCRVKYRIDFFAGLKR